MKTLVFARNGLIVLCGPAGCGKSYFAQRYFKKSQIVSSDECREMIADDPNNQRVSPDAFELMEQIIEYRLKWNRLAVADATHLTGRYRQSLRHLAEKYGRPIYLVVFDADAEICLRHNAARPRRVEPEVIAAQVERFQTAKVQIPTETYQAVYVLSPDDIDQLQLELI